MLRFSISTSALAVAAAIALSGCALTGASTATNTASEEGARDARLVAGGAVQPVSYRKPPTLRVSRPVGLAPCAQGAFATDDCWRKGDEHILFPSDAPLGEPSALVSPVPSDAD
ncbi:MAG TPA: hypothetical protein PLV61_10820 [Parvularculaceae bacterium]|nr:hypothetical protein [Caulobacterales bacterium]HPE31673.1 hypothetical protein [Parvularculaceae bacterium]HRX37962.1 hypothetical protein [Parvularculaceae bacterium]